MAEKFSVLIKYKYLEYIENAGLSDAEAWTFMRAIIEYDKTGNLPKFKNPVMTGLFAVLKFEIDEENKKHPRGEGHWAWRGGRTSEYKAARSAKEYKHWRDAVFRRDNYTCQECGKCGVKLRAHHKKGFARYPKLRFDISNGITYCEDCHKKWHKEHGK